MCIPTCTHANIDMSTRMCINNNNYILQYLLLWILDLIRQNPRSNGFNELEKIKSSKAMKPYGHSL